MSISKTNTPIGFKDSELIKALGGNMFIEGAIHKSITDLYKGIDKDYVEYYLGDNTVLGDNDWDIKSYIMTEVLRDILTNIKDINGESLSKIIDVNNYRIKHVSYNQLKYSALLEIIDGVEKLIDVTYSHTTDYSQEVDYINNYDVSLQEYERVFALTPISRVWFLLDIILRVKDKDEEEELQLWLENF